MADTKDWTEADDAQLRRAMATLRADVDAMPLPDVRFVKARGMQRRRQRMLTWTAAAASAAIVVAGVAGYAAIGPERAQNPLQPATRTTGTGAAPTPSTTAPLDSLGKPGALPLLEEWTRSLALTGTVRLTPVKPFGPVECLSSEPGTKVQQDEITREPELQGGQTRFTIGRGQEVETAAQQVAQDIASCQAGPGYKVTLRSKDQTWPRLFTFTAGDAGSGWWAVVPGLHDVVVLQVNQNDRPTSSFTREQVTDLVDIATKRLARYGTGSSAGSTTAGPTPVSPPATRGPKAINEKMPVTGPDPVPSSDLFVAGSQWTSPRFAKGSKAYAGPGSTEGSTAIIECETDEQQAGVAGRVGVVSIRAGAGDANYIGQQRVRVFDDVAGYELVQADLQRIDALVMAGCSSAGGANRTSAERGPVQGTYLLTTRVTAEAKGTMYQWVGVTGQQTEGAISTIVFHGTDDGQGFQGGKQEGFTELVRLMDLARQK